MHRGTRSIGSVALGPCILTLCFGLALSTPAQKQEKPVPKAKAFVQLDLRPETRLWTGMVAAGTSPLNLLGWTTGSHRDEIVPDEIMSVDLEDLEKTAHDDHTRDVWEGQVVEVSGEFLPSPHCHRVFNLIHSQSNGRDCNPVQLNIGAICNEAVTHVKAQEWVKVIGRIEFHRRADGPGHVAVLRVPQLKHIQPAQHSKCVAISGALLQKGKGDWVPVKVGESLAAETWLVALPKSVIESQNGAVQLRLEADIGKHGPYPVLETAVELLPSSGADMELRFDRGIIVLKNQKKDGDATVTVHVRDKVWAIILKGPDSEFGMELYSRHEPGVRPIEDKKISIPVANVQMLVLKGKVDLASDGVHHALEAPPGNAGVMWNSVSKKFDVRNVKEIPKALMHLEPKDQEKFTEICSCASHLHGKDLGHVLDEFLKSANKTNRLIGVTAAGAVDDIGRVVDALANPNHSDLRDHSVLVLRHWLGRQPGHVAKLVKVLTIDKKFKLAQAQSIVQLLFGFSEEDLLKPATYDLLIPYLNHSQLAVRELAYWNLIRLVPEGKAIAYDPAWEEGDRAKAIEQWRKLIPEGKLPQVDKGAGPK